MKQITKQELFLLFSIFGVLLILIGANINNFVLRENGFMPVIVNNSQIDYSQSKELYKVYPNCENIKYCGLSDIFSIFLSSYTLFFSLGDIIAIIGVIISITSIVKWIKCKK